MKKKQMAGILGVILIVLACYVAYYQFWMALVGFGLSAVALPIVFWLISRKGAWFSLPFAVLLDVVLYWQEYGYYESRGLFAYATLVQLAIMAVILLLLGLGHWLYWRHPNSKNKKE